MTITRWNPCPAEPEEDDDGPLFQGFLTDPQGEWVKWEDIATLGSHASDLHELRTVQAENERLQKMLDVCSEVHAHNVKLKAEVNERIENAVAEQRLRQATEADNEKLKSRLAALAELVEKWSTFGVAGDCRKAILSALTK